MIEDIHTAIHEEFQQRKITPYHTRMNLEDMVLWSESISTLYGDLDKPTLQLYTKDIYWGLASLYMNMGYLFISFKEVSYPSGAIFNNDEASKRNLHVADIHYWYHSKNCWESIYRVWERVVSLLETRFTPCLKKNFYFDGYIDYILENKILFKREIEWLKKI